MRINRRVAGLLLAVCASAAAFDLQRTPGALSRYVEPVHYTVEIEADPHAERFAGSGTITLRCSQPGHPTRLLDELAQSVG